MATNRLLYNLTNLLQAFFSLRRTKNFIFAAPQNLEMLVKRFTSSISLKFLLLFAVSLFGARVSEANDYRRPDWLVQPGIANGAGSIQLSDERTESVESVESLESAQEVDMIRAGKSLVHQKRPVIRRKIHRLIEGNHDHVLYARTVCYAHALLTGLCTNYETPFFLSEQHSFLYRLAIF
ncbi:hypothetical protein [Pedobacter sp. SYP-B3415]|uniref:hypothetical protein n=1 Tax=Pedobacter sp. SYP-B3415 TaxID=2496641 RepID=UPI00101DC8CF|nr:hypothetical protein [Pedobacter sp. SYP-B3415]